MSILGKNLALIRKQHNLTQKKVSEFLGISMRTYQTYEQGTRKPSIDTLKTLSTLFKTPINSFTEGLSPELSPETATNNFIKMITNPAISTQEKQKCATIVFNILLANMEFKL